MIAEAPVAFDIVPARFRGRTLAGYVPSTDSQRAALEAAERVAGGAIRNLVLVGQPGLGKTHLAAAIFGAIAQRDWEAYELAQREAAARWPAVPKLPRWLNVADALVNMRLEFGSPIFEKSATNALLDGRSYPGLLVLDDLGRERVSDWTGEVIYALVNARYEAMLPTVVTSNLTPKELAESPYWPCVSRLAEDGALIKLDGKDWRLGR
jgi:DNA replication protein DnaC